MRIGVDIGGSLTKIVMVSGCERQYSLLDHTDAKGVAATLPQEGELFLTGCGARELLGRMRRTAQVCDELQSFCAGARQLVLEDNPAAEPFVLASMGTGTSVFHVSAGRSTRAAGTGVGGGTITGLGKLLLSTGEFPRIADLASKGQRGRVDLMVSDLYPDAAQSPVLSALTAANFGRAGLPASGLTGPGATGPGDLASAIVQLAVETVAVLSIQVARTYKAQTIVVAGSPSSHPLVQQRFIEIGDHLGHRFSFLQHGAFCGALGAVLLGSK